MAKVVVLSEQVQRRLQSLVPSGGYGRAADGRGKFVDDAIVRFLDELGDRKIPRVCCNGKQFNQVITSATHLRMRHAAVDRGIPSSNVAIVAVAWALDLLEQANATESES